MKIWSERPKEIAYLLNPAFCGEILYKAIEGYQCHYPVMPFSLIFFILPLMLYDKTFETFSMKISHLSRWIQSKPEILEGFEYRVKDYKQITQEALLFLSKQELIKVCDGGFAIISQGKKKIQKSNKYLYHFSDKAYKLGIFLAKAGRTENVYIILGVTP